jgi:nucleotide-binding universal stress UspA family protein
VTIHKDGITEHIRSQEDDYFRRKDRELVERLRKADADAKARQALEQETGLHDPAMLRELDQLGFTPETIALLPLVPLLQVAWAKAGISAAERAMIVKLARSRGIADGSVADHVLELWLDVKPSDDTFHKAARLISAIIESPDHRVHVSAEELLEYCEKIAHSSGGIFGIGTVSPEERAAISEIAAGLKHRS